MLRSILFAIFCVLTLAGAAWYSPVLAQEAAADAAAEEPEAPAYPDGLDDPAMALDELRLRLIPLTVTELEALAAAWQGIAQDQTQGVSDQQIAILRAEGEEADTLRMRLTEMMERRGLVFENYSAVVDAFAKKGGDQAAVDSLRLYRSAILVDEKQNADFQTLLDQSLAWTVDKDGGIRLGIRVATIIAAFVALVLVSRTIRGIARRSFARVPNLSKLLQSFLAMVVYWITIAFGLMIVLSALGIDITPIFALVGGLSFIIAFAFQDTLGNLAAGLMIMFNRPFDEGDYVTIAGMGGTVKSVSVVSTKITTPDNQVIVIPNSKVWGDVITNTTASATRRVDLVFGIGYDDDIGKAHEVLEQVVAEHPMVLGDPAPVIRVNALGASSVDFICRPWVNRADYWTVYWDLTRQVKEAFDKAGISIPFPQTDMHLHVASGVAPAPLVGLAPTQVEPGDDEEGMGRPKGAPDFKSGDDGAES